MIGGNGGLGTGYDNPAYEQNPRRKISQVSAVGYINSLTAGDCDHSAYWLHRKNGFSMYYCPYNRLMKIYIWSHACEPAITYCYLTKLIAICITIADFHTFAHGHWTGAKEEHPEGYRSP